MRHTVNGSIHRVSGPGFAQDLASHTSVFYLFAGCYSNFLQKKNSSITKMDCTRELSLFTSGIARFDWLQTTRDNKFTYECQQRAVSETRYVFSCE